MKNFLFPVLFTILAVLAATDVQARDIRKPLRFERGASSATVEGAVIRGDRDVYEVHATAGQTMEVTITALEKNAAFVILGPGKKNLTGAGDGDDATHWRGELPLSGRYRIEVGGTRGNAEYAMKVAIQ